MKNIVFDLGGVVVARDRNRCGEEFARFMECICCNPMPQFWVEYDRGALSRDEVEAEMAALKGCDKSVCHSVIDKAISIQAPIEATARLIGDLKRHGYRLYVLSNMSADFIAHIRRFEVYRLFDGEVVSCEEKTVKPEEAIYRRLLDRYSLEPAQTLFIDDRRPNLDAAERLGISTFHFTEPREESCRRLREMLLPEL